MAAVHTLPDIRVSLLEVNCAPRWGHPGLQMLPNWVWRNLLHTSKFYCRVRQTGGERDTVVSTSRMPTLAGVNDCTNRNRQEQTCTFKVRGQRSQRRPDQEEDKTNTGRNNETGNNENNSR